MLQNNNLFSKNQLTGRPIKQHNVYYVVINTFMERHKKIFLLL